MVGGENYVQLGVTLLLSPCTVTIVLCHSYIDMFSQVCTGVLCTWLP